MSELFKPRRGAPLGNQNARKHGFYSCVLDKDQKRRLKKAASVEGLDNEIVLLRVKLVSILENDPDNYTLILRIVSSLARLLRVREKLSTTRNDDLRNAIYNVIKDIGIPLGLGRALLSRDSGQPPDEV
jgi:hypothetical protein